MLLWGLGKTADAAILHFLSMFLLYYYNQILGLKPFLATVALAIAMLTDAISDPSVGLYSDYQSMSGQRRNQLMKISILPTAVTFLMLFLFELGSSQLILFIQLTTLTITLRFCLTLYIVPREAIGVQIFNEYSDRNELWAINAFFSVFGSSLALGPTLLFFLNNWENKSGYISAAIWTSLVYLLFSIWCSASLNSCEIKSGKDPAPIRKFSFFNIFLELRLLIRNRSWLMLFLGSVFLSLQTGLNTGSGLYFNNFLWHWKPEDLFWGGIVSLPGSILGATLFLYIKIKDKRYWALRIGLLATLITPSLLFFRLIEIHYPLNLLPEVGQGSFSSLWILWVIHQFFENFVWTIFWVLIASMFSDTIEEQELSTGSRLDGTVLSANNFINKSLLSGGILFSGILLTIVGFDSATTLAEKEIAANKLGLFSIVTVFSLFPVALFFISKYRITKISHEDNLQKLRSK